MKNFILLTQTDKLKPIELRHSAIISMEPRNEINDHTKINLLGIPFPLFVTESRDEIESLIEDDSVFNSNLYDRNPVKERAFEPIDEALLLSTDDPAVWASEFAKFAPSIDQATMIGWFANCAQSAKNAQRAVQLDPASDPLATVINDPIPPAPAPSAIEPPTASPAPAAKTGKKGST